MGFLTLDNLIARFGELLLIRLTDDEGIGIIDEKKTAPAISAVNGEVAGYLRERYPLPLSMVPAELQGYAEDMALERIYSGKPERETPKDVKDRAKEARVWLRDVQRGSASLNLPLDPVTATDVSSPNQIKVATGSSSLDSTLDRYMQ